MRLKPWVRRAHLVLAAVAGIPLLVLAVSGALLVYPDTVRRVVHGDRYVSVPAGPVLPPSQLIASAEGHLPAGDKVVRIQYPSRPDGVLVRSTREGGLAVVDPYTAG